MYCSNCGQRVNTSLNYCNHCGTRLDNSSLVVTNSSSKVFARGSVFIGLGGLFGFFPLLREMLHSGLDTSAMIVILITYLATVFLMFSVLLGHVWKRSGDVHIERQRNDRHSPDAFPTVNTAQLSEPVQPVMSVTDHTTRTLEYEPAKHR